MADFGQYLANIKNSAVSIFEGMAVTFSWMFRRPTTIQYPDRTEKPVRDMIPERSRGILEVDVKTCIADSQCMRACPIGIILIEYGKTADGKGRTITRFDIDASKCMYCGFCTEVCPTNAIRHTHEFEGCSRDIRNLVLHFVDEPVPPYKLQKDVTPPTPPLGEILRTGVLKKWDQPYRQWQPKAEQSAEVQKAEAKKAEPSAEAQKAEEQKSEQKALSEPTPERKAEARSEETPAPAPKDSQDKPPAPEPLPVPEGIRAGDILAAVDKAISSPPVKAPLGASTEAQRAEAKKAEEQKAKQSAEAQKTEEKKPETVAETSTKDHVVEAIHEESPWTKQLVKTPEPEVVHGNVELPAEPLPVPQPAATQAVPGRGESDGGKAAESEALEPVPEEPGFVPPPDDPEKSLPDRFLAAMPGVTDCEGFCGYHSCREYANALATRQEFEHDLCDRGGRGTSERIALLLRKLKKKETVKTE